MPKKEENEDNVCRWLECHTQYDTAEDLFNHVCTAHIGRKSAGTLSLECKWTGCRAKASKRDHLTSHCRVHIALKPHVCTICTKAFKRPQDLKKHEKIHTEEHQAQHRINKSTITVPSNDPLRAGSDDPLKPHLGQHLPQHHAPHLPQQQQHQQHQQQQQHVPQVAQVPYPFAFPAMASAFPYLFAQPGQPAQQPQPQQPPQQGQQQQFALPGQMSQMDLACFIALQQQLNSQAQAASVLPGMPAGLPAAYAMQLGQQALQQFLPQGAGGMYPYGNAPFGFSAPPQAQPHYSTTPTPAPAPAQQQQGAHPTPPSSSSPAQGQSLYPTLPQSLYGQQQPAQAQAAQASAGYNPHQPMAHPQPHAFQHAQPQAVKVEDLPSPANSARSHHSHYSSSLSPGNVPALSPPSSLTPENSFSPSPVPEHDAQRRHHHRASYGHAHGGGSSGNSVAGKKRGFEEATGQFLGALANKRFQDAESVGAQLDSLSSFLLTPELSAHALTPPGLGDDSGSGSSSSGSEYGSSSQVFEREEVDTINQLLLSLNQSFDTDLAASAGGLDDVHGSLGLDLHGVDLSAHDQHLQHQHRPIAGLPSSASAFVPQPPSLYPNLSGATLGGQRTVPAPASYPTLPSSMPSYGYTPLSSSMSAQDPQLRLAKSVAPPTIANDYRPTQYHHIGRLQRAAPSASSSAAPLQSIEDQVAQELLDADMDVDDEVKDAAAALLMGKSLSRTAAPQLPPLATAMCTSPDLRLAPIVTRAGSASRLPPIRDLLALRSPENDVAQLDSPSSPVASGSSSGRAFAFSSSASSTASSTTSSASATASSSRASTAPLYPSLASIAPTSASRPVSAGGVERLTHRVHKMRIPTSDVHEAVREADADLSASSDEEDDTEGDHPSSSKKSRVGEAPFVESPPPYSVKEEDLDEDEESDQLASASPSSSSTIDEAEVATADGERKPLEAAARAELEERARIVARRKAVIAYLVLHVNTAYRAQLARKSMKDVRRALKKPSSGAGSSTVHQSSSLAAAAHTIKEEADRDVATSDEVEASA
ncbi:hypothetical protein JCM9279_004363 [Rhodotorula babjevae]